MRSEQGCKGGTLQSGFWGRFVVGGFHRIVLVSIFWLGMSYMASAAPVTNLADLGEITILPGESVVFSQIVSNVTIDGETAIVGVNFADTSQLAEGRHRLVYTAMTFSGKSAVKSTFLNVGKGTQLVDPPVISGVANRTFTEGRCYNLLRPVAAKSATGEPLVCRVNIAWPEQLAPGTHTVYFTAIDAAGKSAVKNCTITVLPLSEKFRRAEWALLGPSLYEKYFEPQRLKVYFANNAEVIKAFGYGDRATEPGISAHISFRNVEFDMLSFGAHPMKVESLCARMVALLKELRHHRRLWYNQPYIIFAVDIRGFQSGTGNKKERGLYSVQIPNAIFRRDDFDAILLRAFKSMPKAEFRSRSDNKGKVCHNLYTAPDSRIRILFEQDLIEGFAWNYTSRWKNGEVTLEEFFDAGLFASELDAIMLRFNRGDFGAFTDPVLPCIKRMHPTP